MSRTKTLIADHRGYTVIGVIQGRLENNQDMFLDMEPVFISHKEMSHTAIKKAVNDAGYGVKAIVAATIQILHTYGDEGILVGGKHIKLDSKQCFYGRKGTKY